jgi:hypothetical protein
MASADEFDELLCIMNERVFNEKAQERNLITGLIERFCCAIQHLHFPRSEQQRCLPPCQVSPMNNILNMSITYRIVYASSSFVSKILPYFC